MKALVAIAVIFTLFIVAPGCKKGSNSTLGNYYMKATVSGDTFDAEGLSKAYFSASYSGGINYSYISGKADDGRFIKLTLVANPNIPIVVGTYPINAATATADYYPKGLDSSYSNAVSGSIVLTSIAPNYEGTFNFICADSTHVDNGTFVVRVQ